MPTTLYLTRHGETLWNASGRIMGHQDAPLTELGTQQAIWLRDALTSIPFTAIYTSSSGRAQTTAEIIRAQHTTPIIADDRLREIYLGNWEGLLVEEIEPSDSQDFYAYRHSPEQYQALNGGETFWQVQQRVVSYVQELIARHEGEQILLVSHSIAMKSLLLHFDQRSLAFLRQPPVVLWTSLSKVVIDDKGAATIALYADTSHHKRPAIANLQDEKLRDGQS